MITAERPPAVAARERVGGVAVDVVGTGLPVTVLAHGLGGSSADTRPLASRLSGTRVLLTFRGHGRSDDLLDGWTYDDLADDLLAVADATGADRACAVSLGAGALLRVLSRDPARFSRLACVLPAGLHGSRPSAATERVRLLGDAVDVGDVATVAALLLAEVPTSWQSRRGIAALLTRRAAALCERPAPRPRGVQQPLPDLTVLSRVTAPALVLAQEGDPLHGLDGARELTAALGSASLEVLPEGGVFWTASRTAQTLLAHHLTPET